MAPLSERMFAFLSLDDFDPDGQSTYYDEGFTDADADESVAFGYCSFVQRADLHGEIIDGYINTDRGALAIRVHRAFLGVTA